MLDRPMSTSMWLAAALLLAAAPDAHPLQRKAPAPKPAIAGFIDMQDIAWHNADAGRPRFTLRYVSRFPGLFAGIVLNATWWRMQPDRDGGLRTARVDRSLGKVRAWNVAHPSAPLSVKLRIYQGNQAPDWAKRIAGGPLSIKRNPAGCHVTDCTITIGKVWNAKYIAAWRAFQARVAARYDSEPLIRSVAITSCAMQTDEPFVMPVDQDPPRGYTDRAGKRCLRGAVEDYAAWKRTAIDYTMNVFDNIVGGGDDPAFTRKVMNACREALGPRCELGNHAFSNDMPPGNAAIVAAIAARGAPIHYQTAGPDSDGFDWLETVKAARADKATGLELWPEAKYGGFMSLGQTEMRRLYVEFHRPVR